MRIEDVVKKADKQRWGVINVGDRWIFLSPRPSTTYEPHKLELYAPGGELSDDRNAHLIYTDAGTGRGLRAYTIYGGAAVKVIDNTNHPLRSSIFFAKVKQYKGRINQSKLVEPTGTPIAKIRNPAIRGYFPVFDADNMSLKLLSHLPAEVWGADRWLEAISEKWA